MTLTLAKGLAFCGLCAALAGAGSAAQAAPYHHYRHANLPYHATMHHAHPAIARQKARYGRAMAHGNYRAAERAHLQAQELRRRNRANRYLRNHR